ncbi:MAG: right-handed parallel beta-helix repeat-containing protein [Candidatus Marinimicrobia bacterium]|nr:right-handed parallel beta-helix repeat-containing protein [Candidatus Neomarinimicrobiota bacterium]
MTAPEQIHACKKRFNINSLVTALVIVLFLASAISGATVYVDKDAAGTNAGSSWTNAYTDLQDALANASSGDDIWVADGTYYPDSTDNTRSISFTMVNGVDMYGGFNGTETLLTQRDYDTNVTILSGEIQQNGDDTDNTLHVVSIPNPCTSTFDGFTVTKGYAVSGASQGGGIYVAASGRPAISNCIISDNTASNNGGGLYLPSSNDMTITNVTFSNNTSGYGGGIYLGTTSATINKCTFTGNSASLTGAQRGGAVYTYSYADKLTIMNCLFYANTSNQYGGAIWTYSNSGYNDIITNCTFYNNSATITGDAIYENNAGIPQVKNCIFWGSSTQDFIGSVTITYSDVQGGYAGTGNINEDPLYTNAGSSDFTVTDYSPCIGTGTATGAPADDINGTTRGTPPDMGAYENSRDTSLPVELSVFTASSKQGVVNLNWITSSEIENLGFILERSQELSLADTWTKIASYLTHPALSGQGSTTRESEYFFTDKFVADGESYRYRLSDVDYQGKVTRHDAISVTVRNIGSNLKPGSFRVNSVYPNPFNPSTTLSYTLEQDMQVSISVLDIRGRVVGTLMSSSLPAGDHSIEWDGTNNQGLQMTGGIYFFNLQGTNFKQAIKIVKLD